MKKIVTVGGATQDIFVYYEDTATEELHRKDNKSFLLLEEGTKIEVDRFHYASGGGATNSAVSFKTLGCDTAIICKVADDDAGNFLLNELRTQQIDTSMATISKEGQTGTSFIIPTPSGNRIIFVHRGTNKTLDGKDIPFDQLKNYDGIYITSLSDKASKLMPILTQRAQEHTTLVANNPGKSQLMGDTQAMEQALQNIDVFMVNAHEAQTFLTSLNSEPACSQRLLKKVLPTETTEPELLTNFVMLDDHCLTIRHFFKEILERGPKIVIVTNGEDGVYTATKEKIYFHKAIPTEMVNSVGAGDSFGSCFFASLLNGYSIETALTFGALNSASVLGTPSAKGGLLTFEELEKRKTKIPSDYLQTFSW